MRTVHNTPTPDYGARVARLRASLLEQGCGALAVSCPQNVRYMVGFAGTSGWLVVSQDDLILATDARYIEQASSHMPCGRAALAGRGLVEYVADYAAERGLENIAFEAANLTCSSFTALQERLHEHDSGCRLMPTTGLVEALREVKDGWELDSIRRAALLADGAVRHARLVLRAGLTEAELAWRLERWLREHGSGAMPFDIIVASGPNASLPHATPSDRPIAEGEPVVIDLGATVDGYCSDITRTLFLSCVAAPFDRIYAAVLAAQRGAIESLVTGMSGREADALARDSLAAAGYGELFTHGLGHGVGLEIHERPTVNARSNAPLLDGMAFTVEPGVYVPGQGGVRIEDTVVLRDGRAEQLTHAAKGDPVVGVRR